MSHLFVDAEDGVRVVSYTASASAKSKATTVTVKFEIADPYQLGRMMDQLSQFHHPRPREPRKPLALPNPLDFSSESMNDDHL